MSIIELFESSDKKKRLSHIRNLIAVAASDGEIDKNELALIFKIGVRVGLSKEELDRIINRPQSVSFEAPDTFRERIEQLYDMVLVMMIDGELHNNEIALCKLVAIRLGFKQEVIGKIVLDIIDVIAKGVAIEIVLSELEKQYA